MAEKNTDSYKRAGVNIEAGHEFIRQIAPWVRATKRSGTNCRLGGFSGVFDLAACGYRDPLLVAATDGVGTKLRLTQQASSPQWRALGQDLVAMCVNDLIVQGAEPLFFLDYIACGSLEGNHLTEIVAGVSEACQKTRCALIGGETAEMPQLYQKADFDLAGFAVGAVERDKLLPKKNMVAGDRILGLTSDGVHANGFSLIRKILDDLNISPQETPHQPLVDILLRPTRLYVAPVLSILREGMAVKGIAHITGGGLVENIPRAITDKTLSAQIDYQSWKRPEIFSFLKDEGHIAEEEMRRVFNCGIGMALIVAAEESDKITQALRDEGEQVFTIGKLVEL